MPPGADVSLAAHPALISGPLFQAGASLACVRKILQHRAPRTTVEVARSLTGSAACPAAVAGRSRRGADFHRPLITNPGRKREGPGTIGDFPKDSRPLTVRAIQDSNLWPLAPEANALSS